MNIKKPTLENPAVVIGEAMIELSNVQQDSCTLGVAGDTYNTSVYISRSGLAVSYITCLGDDLFSDRISNALESENIDIEHVLRRSGASGLYAISVDDFGERAFSYWRSNSVVRQLFNTQGIDNILEKLALTPLLYFSGITLSLFDDVQRNKLVELAKKVRLNGGVVAFDTNYRSNCWSSRLKAQDAVKKLMPYVSLAMPTFDDEVLLFDDIDAESCAERWLTSGAEEVIVKDGSHGVYIAKHGWELPPAIVKPIDTTGAGDSFNGGYLSARLRGADPVNATLQGQELAAKVLMTTGAILPKYSL